MPIVEPMLLDRAKQLEPRLREIRRELHRWPELGFQEFRTAARIAEVLSSLGVPFRSGPDGDRCHAG